MARKTTAYKAWQRFAIMIVGEAKRRGIIPSPHRLDCVDCARKAKQYEHRDYGKPLSVQPVCYSCNKKRGSAVIPTTKPPKSIFDWEHYDMVFGTHFEMECSISQQWIAGLREIAMMGVRARAAKRGNGS